MVKDIKNDIIRLKKEKGICILAHCYQSPEILEIADFTGDSFALSVEASKVKTGTVIMCGVRFMAETVKILSPEKKVILADPNAGCPMAEMMSPDDVIELKKKHPGYAVVAYINTTSRLKKFCDVCVTSSSALKICRKLDNDNIIFIPDRNLGSWISHKLPEKSFVLPNGFCPVHDSITTEDVMRAKELHPNAQLLVHPECKKQVTELADYAGSTTDIMDFAAKSNAEEFIIATENNIVEHLKKRCGDKRFYPVSDSCVCSDMRGTTLETVRDCCLGSGGEEITLDSDVYNGAKKCIDKMISLGQD